MSARKKKKYYTWERIQRPEPEKNAFSISDIRFSSINACMYIHPSTKAESLKEKNVYSL